ncbi:chromosome segregation protein SMC [Thermosipho melanesiensis]|uniref:DNA repair protein RecN n=2 Tax=Thermosipho melanesiensis TaxID=46541 RepID=A6LN53_THEM4|nr:chromosome segregation protein SMC [Thermosipho melanesiensis]ABR31354.1 SMC domain protein [Thermosipho melanesiensis BI429]APT74414.1 chromosome segregation protein SMC [Thermosipho melanesiensis]OOC36377.1 chromosome segregation protein SMC [Thermosipho melanesiensis]OOC37195.1 chromosome segregation protein SMC [Thermosipho melanesiensis]OOC37947.1 chromosome segregation protein SMC [Thermosipho melanesiensis]
MKSAQVLSVHLHDYLYFKDIDIFFDSRLNVITGETGAGKSLILDVFGILLDVTSGRVDNYSADVVMNILTDYPEYNIYSGENVFSITKRANRTVFKINGKVYPKRIVSNILSDYITLHRQNSQMKILDPNFILNFLDEVSQNQEILKEYRNWFEKYGKIQKLLSEYSLEKLKMEFEVIKEKIEEIERINPSIEEEEDLNRKYKVALKFQETVEKYGNIINYSEEVTERLWEIKNLVDEKYEDSVNTAIDIVETLKLDLQKELDEIEGYDAKEIEERIWDYNLLKRKYGPTIEDVLENYKLLKKQEKEITERIELLESSSERRKKVLDKMKQYAKNLSERRKKAAEKVLNEFYKHSKDLNLSFELEFEFSKVEFNNFGYDKVELLGSAVKGEKLKPVRNVASGGELSRLMLALELSIVSDGVLIFDEVDAGISGITGNKLADKLKEVSKNYQVIVVTHLPQIAIKADKHFMVNKEKDFGEVLELDERRRTEEVKRMLGDETVLKFIKE